MKKQFLEAGKILNTHGIRGEVKIQPWANGPDFLCGFKRVYIDEKPLALKHPRPHKQFVLAALEGIEDVNQAMRLKNKLIYINRDDVQLEPGEFFLQDIIGAKALDGDTDRVLGTLTDVLELPAGRVYVISGEKEHLVPAVPEFVLETNVDAGYLRLRLIEGM